MNLQSSGPKIQGSQNQSRKSMLIKNFVNKSYIDTRIVFCLSIHTSSSSAFSWLWMLYNYVVLLHEVDRALDLCHHSPIASDVVWSPLARLPSGLSSRGSPPGPRPHSQMTEPHRPSFIRCFLRRQCPVLSQKMVTWSFLSSLLMLSILHFPTIPSWFTGQDYGQPAHRLPTWVQCSPQQFL
jgi:hypothetical protein